MNTFITSDWHLGENRWEIMARPGFETEQDMVDLLVKNHNAMVSPDDLVIHVGDVVYEHADKKWFDHIDRFAGRKVLICGNHERGVTDLLEPYFDEIIPEGEGMELEIEGIKCWATHHPSCSRHDMFNLVGHVHSTWKVQLNMLNVGVDAHHYFPVSTESVAFYHKAVKDFYDADIWAAYTPFNMMYFNRRGKQTSYFLPKKC